QEVLVGLLVARGHPPEVLHPAPEAFRQVALLVQVFVDLPLLLAALLRRDHRTGAHGLYGLDHRLAVVGLVRHHPLHFRPPSPAPPPPTSARAGPPARRPLALLTSASWPAVSFTTTGSPSPVTAVCIFVPQPPRLLPNACSACPPVPSAFF